MKFSVATVLAFAAAVLAQPKLTNSKYELVEGEPFTFTWDGQEGEVTLTLKNGDPKNLKDVTVIASGLTGGEFTWTPEDLPSDTYAIEISDESGVPNYSPPFEYEGTGTLPTASSSAPASSSEPSSTITSAASTAESSSFVTSAASTASESESSTSSSTTTTSRTAPLTTPTNQNEGQRYSSPLALLLVTVAAVFFFN